MNRPGTICTTSAALLLSALLLHTVPSAAQTVAKRFLIFDPPGSTGAYVAAITDDGVVVGSYTDSTGATHGFLRRTGGAFVSFDVPGAEATIPTSINPQGEIVGAYCVGSTTTCSSSNPGVPPFQGFLRARNGWITTFSVPPGFSMEYALYSLNYSPPSINPAGTVVGTYAQQAPQQNAELFQYGFLRTRKGEFIPLDFPGVASVQVMAINPSGTIIGAYAMANVGGFVGFVLTPDGQVNPIDIPGCTRDEENSYPSGINSSGAVVGTAMCGDPNIRSGYVRTPDGTVSLFNATGLYGFAAAINGAGAITGWTCSPSCIAFLRTPDGVVSTLSPPGSTFSLGSAINARGTIAGAYYDSANVSHGLLWFTRPRR